jgi:hypothetical protein
MGAAAFSSTTVRRANRYSRGRSNGPCLSATWSAQDPERNSHNCVRDH